MPNKEAGLHLAERDSHSAICLPSDRICAWGTGLSPSKVAGPGNAVNTPSRGIGVSSQSGTPRKLRPLSPVSLGDVGRSFRQSHHGNQLSACSGPATRGINPVLWESLPSGTPLATPAKQIALTRRQSHCKGLLVLVSRPLSPPAKPGREGQGSVPFPPGDCYASLFRRRTCERGSSAGSKHRICYVC
jgi:hypothetical protein